MEVGLPRLANKISARPNQDEPELDSLLLATEEKSCLSDVGECPASPRGSTASRGAAKPNEGFKRSWPQRVVQFLISNWERATLLGIIITLIILVWLKGFTVFNDILRFFQRQNNWMGWLIFTVFYCANVSLFLPGLVLILGAGFVFGFWRGLLAVWLGGSIGQALAFLLARYLVRDWVVSIVKGKFRKWDLVDKAIELEGWKLLLLLRLSPAVPYNLLNITMASTRINFWQFSFTSAVGIIFECSVLTYFGSLAEDVTQVASGRAGPKGPTTWVLLGVSVASCILAATWATIVVRRAIKRAEAVLSQQQQQQHLHMDSPSKQGPPSADSEMGYLQSPQVLTRRPVVPPASGTDPGSQRGL